MQYIVLDLEWNQPTGYNSPAYKSVRGKLLFELIQIGAVRVDEQLHITDSFTRFISPKHYSALHPRIAQITHIRQEDLDDAADFATVLNEFAQWCGDDYVFLTWGPDDSSVLQHNIDFFKCEARLSPAYDLQRRYADINGNTKERAGLKTAMDELQIVPDDSLPFHNALNDAYYTALVFAALPDPEKVLSHPVTVHPLRHQDRTARGSENLWRVRSIADAMRSPMVTCSPCPVCGRKYELAQGYLRQRTGESLGLGLCAEHGLYYSRVSFSREGHNLIMTRSIKLSDEQNPAYVHTKLLQWQNRLAAAQSENQGGNAE